MMLQKKRFITYIFLFLLFIAGGAMYSKQFVNSPASEQKSPSPEHVTDTVFNRDKSNIQHNKETDSSMKSAIPEEDSSKASHAEEKKTIKASTKQPDEKKASENQDNFHENSHDKSTVLDTEISNTIQRKIGKPIEPADLFHAVSIILRKLSEDEIIFLLSFSDKNYTMEEFKEIKKLLFSRLSGEDIETLSALAEKYGKELDVFIPDS